MEAAAACCTLEEQQQQNKKNAAGQQSAAMSLPAAGCTLEEQQTKKSAAMSSALPEVLEPEMTTGGGCSGALVMMRRSYSADKVRERLSRTAREQRARFYIMRRCVQMLLCWRDDN
ncbi:hypothetical protein ABZP36_029227 [Zizania latifolia]